MGSSFKYALAILLLSLLAISTYADYASTEVYFSVPISTSFTVTLPGEAGVASDGSLGAVFTADIFFNSTVPTNTSLQPCVAPGTTCQDTDAIFEYDNTGTVAINISLQFNASLPTGVTVNMNSSATAGGTVHEGLIPVNNTEWAPVILELPIGADLGRAWLFADFSSYTGTNVRWLTHNSTT